MSMNMQPQYIAIDQLLDNPYQPRSTTNDESLQQLAETIRSQGFQGVLVARIHPRLPGKFQLTAGHRRRDAARMAGLTSLPVMIDGRGDFEMMTIALTENVQREDLTPLEEGKLFQRMIDTMKVTQDHIADAIKKTRGYVRNRLQLVQAPPDIQEFASTEAGTLKAVGYLLKIPDPAERAPIIRQLLEGVLVTEDLPTYIEARRDQQTAAPRIIEQTIWQDASSEPVPTIAQVPRTAAQDASSVAIAHTQAASGVDTALALARAQTAKLKLVCKHMEHFEHWLHNKHVPMSDAERTMLQQHADMVQHVLQTY